MGRPLLCGVDDEHSLSAIASRGPRWASPHIGTVDVDAVAQPSDTLLALDLDFGLFGALHRAAIGHKVD